MPFELCQCYLSYDGSISWHYAQRNEVYVDNMMPSLPQKRIIWTIWKKIFEWWESMTSNRQIVGIHCKLTRHEIDLANHKTITEISSFKNLKKGFLGHLNYIGRLFAQLTTTCEVVQVTYKEHAKSIEWGLSEGLRIDQGYQLNPPCYYLQSWHLSYCILQFMSSRWVAS